MHPRTIFAIALFLSPAACGGSNTQTQDPGVPDAQTDGSLGAIGTGLGPAAVTGPSGFYVDPDANAAIWVKNNAGDPRAAAIRTNIATKPGARWFGNWSGDIGPAVSSYVGAAAAKNQWPILVAYNIPGRDCGGASSGGAGSPDAYRTWIGAFAAAIGDRAALVVIEPDAVAQIDCLPSAADKQTRLDLLKYATQQFHDHAPGARAYLDGGNAHWIAAGTMAPRLDSAGLRNVRGFSLNVSNFYTTSESTAYGAAVNSALSSQFKYTSQFVVDTSRNGNGSNGEWCNPAGRRLGTVSQFGGGADALLWVKAPGDSDGPCGTAPNTPAGTFSPDLAVHLINGQ